MAKFISKSTGNQLTAAEYNNVQLPREDLLVTAGITGVSGDNTQMAKAIADYVAVGSFYTDSGAADAYVLSSINSFRAPEALIDGLEVRFRAANANTGASTINVAGLGVVNIKKADGATDLDADDITDDRDTHLRYDGTSFIITQPFRQLQSVQTFTSSGTWNKPAGINAVLVEVQAGGGGGSGAPASKGNAGGAAGGYAKKLITSGLGSTETITIGAGGAGGAAGGNPGISGATSSFGAHASATGGGGAPNGAGSTLGGVGSGGDVNIAGNPGHTGDNDADASTPGGNGGSSVLGAGGLGQLGTGSNGSNGGGGAGGHNNNLGGDGGNGIIIVWEYS